MNCRVTAYAHRCCGHFVVSKQRGRRGADVDGAYRVTLDVQAAKLQSDGIGNETEIAMNDWVETGVFAATAGRLGETLYLGKHRIRSGEQTITVIVPREPARAGIYPYHLLIHGTSKTTR